MNDADIKKLDQSILKAREVHARIIRDEQDGLELDMLNLLVDLINLKAETSQQKTATSRPKTEIAGNEAQTQSTMENDTDQAKNRIPQWKSNQSQLS